jgi:hypothetical protein
MKLAFTFMNATIDKIIKTLFHSAQFELWDCEIYIYILIYLLRIILMLSLHC